MNVMEYFGQTASVWKKHTFDFSPLWPKITLMALIANQILLTLGHVVVCVLFNDF